MTPLSNGNYVVTSPDWANGAAGDAGAVTWGSGTAGVSGVVSATNSLVGSTAGDSVGENAGSVLALSNGNYVVSSQYWNNGARGRGHVGQRHGRRQRSRQCHEQPGRHYGE